MGRGKKEKRAEITVLAVLAMLYSTVFVQQKRTFFPPLFPKELSLSFHVVRLVQCVQQLFIHESHLKLYRTKRGKKELLQTWQYQYSYKFFFRSGAAFYVTTFFSIRTVPTVYSSTAQ